MNKLMTRTALVRPRRTRQITHPAFTRASPRGMSRPVVLAVNRYSVRDDDDDDTWRREA